MPYSFLFVKFLFSWLSFYFIEYFFVLCVFTALLCFVVRYILNNGHLAFFIHRVCRVLLFGFDLFSKIASKHRHNYTPFKYCFKFILFFVSSKTHSDFF